MYYYRWYTFACIIMLGMHLHILLLSAYICMYYYGRHTFAYTIMVGIYLHKLKKISPFFGDAGLPRFYVIDVHDNCQDAKGAMG